MTAGKASDLKCEPLKAVIVSRLSAATTPRDSIDQRGGLRPLTDECTLEQLPRLCQPLIHSSLCPRSVFCKVPSPSHVVPGYMDRTLTLDVAHYLRHSIFRWNRDQ
jgi:hypothetical protein